MPTEHDHDHRCAVGSAPTAAAGAASFTLVAGQRALDRPQLGRADQRRLDDQPRRAATARRPAGSAGGLGAPARRCRSHGVDDRRQATASSGARSPCSMAKASRSWRPTPTSTRAPCSSTTTRATSRPAHLAEDLAVLDHDLDAGVPQQLGGLDRPRPAAAIGGGERRRLGRPPAIAPVDRPHGRGPANAVRPAGQDAGTARRRARGARRRRCWRAQASAGPEAPLGTLVEQDPAGGAVARWPHRRRTVDGRRVDAALRRSDPSCSATEGRASLAPSSRGARRSSDRGSGLARAPVLALRLP